MEIWQTIVTIVTTIIASNGLWAFITFKSERKSKSTKLLLGLAYDRIVDACNKYLECGSITLDEYENLYKYLYKPYAECGGNGIAELQMQKVKKMYEENKK